MKRKIKYTEEPMGELKVIKDHSFLDQNNWY